MAQYSNKTSVFEKITSVDYCSKRNGHPNLPKINYATPESGREVNVIEAKLTRSQAKKTTAAALTTPKKNSVATPADKTPTCYNRMKFNLLVTPQSSKKMNSDHNGNFDENNRDNILTDVNCTYEFKGSKTDEVIENSKFYELTKGNKRNKNMEQFGTSGPNIALNVNLALNMDSSNQNGKSSKSDANGMSVRKSLTSDTHSSITVAVRMRPLLEKEKSLKADLMMRDNHVVIPSRKETFQFDHCLNSAEHENFEYASQDVVYRKMAEPLLEEAFKGYNTCLFAYGQSGSGKTHTMMGTDEVPGIIPRFINDLFKRTFTSGNIESIVNISFIEIYNEKINDLLADEVSMFTKKLKVREDPQTGPYVEDLTVYTIDNCENAMELLKTGNSRRSTASTQSNETSSRSHSIFSIILVQNKKVVSLEDDGDVGAETSVISKIHLVDLAGSERANMTNTARFNEGVNINKSLLTLGKVITQLAEAKGDRVHGHIPYRESVLTYLLKDSLGGNSRTSMIATISPAKTHLDETLSTLRYASTAQKIVNTVHINDDPKMKVIDSLLKQISFLKKEVSKNKADSLERLTEHSSSGSESELSPGKCNAACNEKIAKKIESLDQKFTELLENQKSIKEALIQFQGETEKPKAYQIDIPSLGEKLLEEIKSYIKLARAEDVLKGAIDNEKLMKQMESNDLEVEEAEVKAQSANDSFETSSGKSKKGKQPQQSQQQKQQGKQKCDEKKWVEEVKEVEETPKEEEPPKKDPLPEEEVKKTEPEIAEEEAKPAEEVPKEEETAKDNVTDENESKQEDEKKMGEEEEAEEEFTPQNKKAKKLSKKEQKALEKEAKKNKGKKTNDDEEIPNARDVEKKEENLTADDSTIHEFHDAKEDFPSFEGETQKESKKEAHNDDPKEDEEPKWGKKAESKADKKKKGKKDYIDMEEEKETEKSKEKDESDDDDWSNNKKGKGKKKGKKDKTEMDEVPEEKETDKKDKDDSDDDDWSNNKKGKGKKKGKKDKTEIEEVPEEKETEKGKDKDKDESDDDDWSKSKKGKGKGKAASKKGGKKK